MSKRVKITIATILTLSIAVGPYLISRFILIPKGMVDANDVIGPYMAGLFLLLATFMVISLFVIIGLFIYRLLDDIF